METEQQVTEQVADTLSNVKESLNEGIHQTSERVEDAAQKVKNYSQQTDNPTVSKYAGEIGENLQKSADYLESHDLDRLTGELKNKLTSTIQKNPLISIGVALTTGFILARLLSRP